MTKMQTKTNDQLLHEIAALRLQLDEANVTIEAIRTGQVDALVVKGKKGHELYTLKLLTKPIVFLLRR